MVENQVLSPSEKIKKIRKKIRATQNDIAGNGISRVRISQIEGGETLTLKVANLLAKNINSFIKKNNIDFEEVTAKYLLESKEEQINQICKSTIDTLGNFKIYKKVMESFESELYSLEKFILKNEPIIKRELKKELYKLASDYYYSIKKYVKSYEYIFKCYQLLSPDKYTECISIILEFTKIYALLGKFDDVVIISKQAYSIATSQNLEYTPDCKCIYFNCALAYKKLEKYDECYLWLQNIYHHCNIEKIDELNIKILQADCCLKKDKLEEALKLNYEVLELSKELNQLDKSALAYANLANIYYKNNELGKAVALIDLSLDIRQTKYKDKIYTYAFYIYKETKETDKAYNYLDSALHEMSKNKNEAALQEVVCKAFDYFVTNNLSEKVLFLLDKIEEIVIRYRLLGKNILDIFIKAHYYFKDIDSDSQAKTLMIAYKLVKFL